MPVVCVQESIADRFVELLKQKAQELRLRAAYLPESQLGPLVSAAQKASVKNWIARGVSEGAQLLLDGRQVSVPGFENGYFVGPTIFDHVQPGHAIGAVIHLVSAALEEVPDVGGDVVLVFDHQHAQAGDRIDGRGGHMDGDLLRAACHATRRGC